MSATQDHRIGATHLDTELGVSSIPSELNLHTSDQQLAADELPMIVWLRGDEAHCPDFSLGVDEVMQRLGIRRSRLTQISGRELRVGRIRKGKYISPVFRPEDVAAYESWTRATATHIKSSTILSDAAQELGKHGREISQQIGDVLATIHGDLAATAGQITSQVNGQMTRALEVRASDMAASLRQLRDTLERMQFAQQSLQNKLMELTARFEQWQAQRGQEGAALLSMTRDLSELNSLVRVMDKVNQEDRQAAALEMQYQRELDQRLRSEWVEQLRQQLQVDFSLSMQKLSAQLSEQLNTALPVNLATPASASNSKTFFKQRSRRNRVRTNSW